MISDQRYFYAFKVQPQGYVSLQHKLGGFWDILNLFYFSFVCRNFEKADVLARWHGLGGVGIF